MNQFITLANFIVCSTKQTLKVPKVLAQSLERAIHLRKEHSSKLQTLEESNSEERVASDKGHAHFVTTLEQTFDILKPYMSSNCTQVCSATQLDSLSGDGIASLGLENRFGALEIEETSPAFEAYLGSPDIDPLVKQDIAQGARYEPEPDTSAREHLLAVRLFWQDVCHIRRLCEQMVISNLGEDYSARAVTINTAITFVRDLENDLEKQFPDHLDYEQKAYRFYFFNCDIHGHDRDYIVDPKAYNLAKEMMLITYHIIIKLQPELGNLLSTQGQFQRDNQSKPWTQREIRCQRDREAIIRDDETFLREAMPDLLMLSSINEKKRLAEDELMRGLKSMTPCSNIPLWFVFAFQCFLDAYHHFGNSIDQPYQNLRIVSNSIRKSVMDVKDFHRSLPLKCWPKQEEQLDVMLDIIDLWMERDIIADTRRNVRYLNECNDLN